jgi:predicted NAD-dependent protein-ADP-ribosyltransferase YbiA (DUF1768 family)
MGAGKRTKFCRLIFHGHLRQQLLSIGNAILIEDVSSRKRGNALFWGAYLSDDT